MPEIATDNDLLGKVRVIRTYSNNNDIRSLFFGTPKDIADMYDLNKPASLYVIPRDGEIGLKKVNLDDIQ